MKKQPAIVADSLVKRFDDFVAVDTVSLTVDPGEVYCLVGPNGAGKTTLIKMLTGQYAIDAGNVTLSGFDIHTQPLQAKSTLGYIPDEPWVYPYLTGREFLTFSAGLYGLKRSTSRIKEVASWFHLAEPLEAAMHTYSRGTKQKIMFMAALLHKPQVLIIDEPIVGLDVFSQEAFTRLVGDFAKTGGSVLMATHSLHVAEVVAGRVGMMDKGKLIAQGSVAQLVKEAKVKSGGLAGVFKKLAQW